MTVNTILTFRHAGDQTVRLTGEFLRNTGQLVGGEGRSVWNIAVCPCGLCKDGRFVAVDEVSQFADDDGRDPSRPRHLNTANLQIKTDPGARWRSVRPTTDQLSREVSR